MAAYEDLFQIEKDEFDGFEWDVDSLWTPQRQEPPSPPPSRSNDTPAEIWTNILDYVLHVPCLFEYTCRDPTDSYFAFKTHSFYSHHLYLESEKQRKVLEKVCTSWRAYAASRQYRYMDTMRLARLKSPNREMAWKRARKLLISSSNLLVELKSHVQFMVVESLNLSFESQSQLFELLPILASLQRLFSLTLRIESRNRSEKFHPSTISNYMPKLRSLILIYSGVISWKPVNFPRLEVLEIHGEVQENINALQASAFPSLIHLTVGGLRVWAEFASLLIYLEEKGKELLSLTIKTVGNWKDFSIPATLWTSCPRLVEFGTDLNNYQFELPPPRNHLRYIVHFGSVRKGNFEHLAQNLNILLELMDDSVRIVIFTSIRFRKEGETSKLISESGLPFRLEDAYLRTYEEYERNQPGRPWNVAMSDQSRIEYRYPAYVSK